MKITIHTKGEAVKRITAEYTPVEWLVASAALKNYAGEDGTKVALEMLATVPELDQREERCKKCAYQHSGWCGDCTENGGRYNYFKVR